MRQVTIHQSLNRPVAVLGCDRELVLGAAGIASIFALSTQTWWGALIALLFWGGSVAVLRRMHKSDPFMRKVAVKHLRYDEYYPAKSGLHKYGSRTPASWI
jgi:type IV secretory pathway TrbD component